jgi:CDP-glucose 4,6-dehydratase
MPDRAFWKGRRVFLTGHTGFKGSWLTLWLNALGADVTGYALDPPTQPSLFEQAGVSSAVRTVRADVRDLPALIAAVAECRPSIVIHMAAQSVVRRGYEDPVETYSSNVMGTVHVLEAVRRCGAPCALVNVTSDKCYENRETGRSFREGDRLGGDDPYSNSKACSELVTSAYRVSFFPDAGSARHGVAVASARAGNVIGGGDWTPDQLVPDLVRAFLAGTPCPIRNPAATRPWQFVLDPLRGYLMLAERLVEGPARFASAWNFGPAEADARPVSWIADRLVRAWGERASWAPDPGDGPPEATRLKLDSAKAGQELGWRPVLPLEQALDWTARWYRAYRTGSDLEALTRAQIGEFAGLADRED